MFMFSKIKQLANKAIKPIGCRGIEGMNISEYIILKIGETIIVSGKTYKVSLSSPD